MNFRHRPLFCATIAIQVFPPLSVPAAITLLLHVILGLPLLLLPCGFHSKACHVVFITP